MDHLERICQKIISIMVSTVVLLGIAAGALVFVGTIVLVYFLLHYGGSFDRMKQEAMGLPGTLGELKPQLYDELLAVAKSRPIKPAALEAPLQGRLVGIRNFSEKQDAAALHAISCGEPQSGIYRELKFDADEMIWRHLDHGPFETAAQFAAVHCAERPDNRHLVITDMTTSEPIGMVSLCHHAPADLRVEIGDLWLVPAFQGSGATSETVLLLLKYLFSQKYRRVEWRCDGHNVRARRAGHSLGFTFEGVMRKHRVVKDCNRDTVVFAVVNSEWPMVEEQLQGKVMEAATKAGASAAEKTPEEVKKSQ